ncbi:SprT family protein [Cytobacillus sp. NCCP-133]|uniref:SprT family protein n=1 Tax=Cytobacillus sp. NCCP-133 TaxID=766848 RepID=UPI002230BE66|nr:SprT family protein [Cytobacillus sp. NCCP-133]GLB61000.1 protein SprT [Cytobacillus sp. NCCP-133]
MNDKDLQSLVEKISFESFEKPFRHKACFNARLRSTGGRYMLSSHHIEINKKYYEQLGLEELIGIIKHELCHYHLHLEGKGYEHRDQDFRMLMNKVEAPRFCSVLPDRPKTNKSKKVLVYVCKECGQTYQRKRMVDTKKYVCGKCKGKLVFNKELTLD